MIQISKNFSIKLKINLDLQFTTHTTHVLIQLGILMNQKIGRNAFLGHLTETDTEQ